MHVRIIIGFDDIKQYFHYIDIIYNIIWYFTAQILNHEIIIIYIRIVILHLEGY